MLCLHNAGDMLETFKHYKEVEHIMIMIIYCYNLHFFILCDIDQQLKITFRKSSGPPEKIHFPLFTLPPKNPKSASPSFLPTLNIFLVGGGGHYAYP